MSEILVTRAKPVAPPGWSCWFSLKPGDPFPEVTEWDSLGAEHSATPFGTAWWQRGWWQSLARPSDRLLVFKYVAGDQVEAIVPLVVRGRLARTLSAPFDPHTPVWDVACTQPDGQLFESLFHSLGPFADRIIFPAAVPGEPLHAGLLEGAERSAAGVVERLDALEAWIDLSQGWEAYLAGRDRKNIQNYARKDRQLARLGRLEYREIASDPCLKGILSECFAVEQSSWKGRLGTAIADRPQTASFYARMALDAAQAGALSLKTLRLDGRLLAFDLSLRHHTEMFALKIGFDPQFAKYSPGQVLVYNMIRRLQKTGLTRFRLGPPSAWKALWTDQVRPLSVVEIIPSHARARALYWLGPGLKRLLKRAPLASSLMRRLRKS